MKKTCLLLLLVLCLFSASAQAQRSLSDLKNTPQDDRERVISAYLGYLDAQEITVRAKSIAYQTTLDFCDMPTWSKYEHACSIMNAAVLEISLQDEPEAVSFTPEQIANADMESTELAETNLSTWSSNRVQTVIALKSQLQDLRYFSFTDQDVAVLQAEIEARLLDMQLASAIDMVMLNDMLTNLSDGQSMYAQAQTQYPYLAQYPLTWCASTQEAEALANDLMDQEFENLDEMNLALTQSTARLYDIQGGTDAAAYIFYAGAPLMIPIPQTDEFEDAAYFDVDAEGHLILSVNGNAAENRYVEWSSDREQFDSYVALLASLDILPVKTSEKEGKQTLLYYGQNDNLFGLTYEADGIASVMFYPGSAAFAPLAYCQAVRAQAGK